MTDTTPPPKPPRFAKITVWLVGGHSIELDVTNAERHNIVTAFWAGSVSFFTLHDYPKGRAFYVPRDRILLIQTDVIDE